MENELHLKSLKEKKTHKFRNAKKCHTMSFDKNSDFIVRKRLLTFFYSVNCIRAKILGTFAS